MKKFKNPQMEMIRLDSKSIIFTSLCSDKYCTGFDCDACDREDVECMSVSPCSVHHCARVKCPSYIG